MLCESSTSDITNITLLEIDVVDMTVFKTTREIRKQENALVASSHVAQTTQILNHFFHQQFALDELWLCVRR
jgi:hypothetical protein